MATSKPEVFTRKASGLCTGHVPLLSLRLQYPHHGSDLPVDLSLGARRVAWRQSGVGDFVGNADRNPDRLCLCMAFDRATPLRR